jgi:hypothetical protein
MTMQSYIDNLAESEEEDDSQQDYGAGDTVSDALALLPQGVEGTLAQYTASGITAWAARAKAYATVVILSTGEVPALHCIRCHREERRQLLLVRMAREAGCKTLPRVAQLAARMAREGCFPGPMERRRRGEFLSRCADALKKVAPNAVCDPKALGKADALALRRALNNKEAPYEGCFHFECMDLPIAWTQDFFPICAHCGQFKAWGRTMHSWNDYPGMQRRMDHSDRIRDTEMASMGVCLWVARARHIPRWKRNN